MAPIDPFKKNHIKKAASKDIPMKINNLHYTSDEALLQSPETIAPGFQAKKKWTTTVNEFRHIGKDRTFDKVIKQGLA